MQDRCDQLLSTRRHLAGEAVVHKKSALVPFYYIHCMQAAKVTRRRPKREFDVLGDPVDSGLLSAAEEPDDRNAPPVGQCLKDLFYFCV